MPLALEDVIAPTAAAEIEAELLSLCATGGLPTTSWQPGGVIRTFIAEVSELVARKSLVEVEIAKGGLGDLASPLWAKLWAQQIYDVIFVPAMAATGAIVATNATATPHDLDPGDLIVAHKDTGKTYRNQEAVTIAASTTTPDIAIAADEVGTASDAQPNAITKVVAPGSLIGVTITNPLAVLGADEEATEALVRRARARLGFISPLGAKGAYEFVAKSRLDDPEIFPAIDGTLLVPTSTPITRAKTVLEVSTGDVVTYCASASGPIDPADVDRIQAAFDRWVEPWTVTSRAESAASGSIPISYRAWARTSLTVAQIQTAIAAALARYLSTVPIGGVFIPPGPSVVYLDSLRFVIRTAVLGVELVEIVSPADDVPIAQNQVPTLGTVTANVTVLS